MNSEKEQLQEGGVTHPLTDIPKRIDHKDSNQTPFHELLLFLSQKSRERLRQRFSKLFSLSCIESVESSLIENLSRLSNRLLFSEFSSFCRLRLGFDIVRFIEPTGHSQAALYAQFRDEELATGCQRLKVEYPEWWRIFQLTERNWLETTSLLLERITCERTLIEEHFEIATDESVTSVNLGAGDLHRGGKSVAIISFATGKQLVYKPRSLALDQAFTGFVEFFRARLKSLRITVPHSLDRGEYGWSEFLEYLPSNSSGSVKEYYLQCGMLTAIWHLLGGTDLHHENIIVRDNHPCVVDVETLLHYDRWSRSRLSAQKNAFDWATFLLNESVLRTAMLPIHFDLPDGESHYDLSGMSGIGKQGVSISRAFMQDMNLNTMRFGVRAETLTRQGNDPFKIRQEFDEKVIPYILKGMNEIFKIVQQNKNELLAKSSVLFSFKHLKSRVIFRPTNHYATFLEHSLHPKYLRSKEKRAEFLESLPSLSTYAGDSEYFAVDKAERNALSSLDIPLITTPISFSPGENVRCDGNGELYSLPTECPFERAISRIQNFSLATEQFQLRLTEESLLGARKSVSSPVHSAFRPSVSELPIVSQEKDLSRRTLGAVLGIGEMLESSAIEAKNGGITWIALGLASSGNRYEHTVVGPGLYHGNTGIAIFLSSLLSINPSGPWSELARKTLLPVFQEIGKLKENISLSQISIHGLSGWPGVLYGLCLCSDRLDERDCLNRAEELLKLIRAQNLETDQYDLLSGIAGTIIASLAFYKVSGCEEALQLAEECASNLIANQTRSPHTNYRSWPFQGDFLCGFAHGAAGICFALARLNQILKSPQIADSIHEALNYETSLFSPALQNWPDLRKGVSPANAGYVTSAWCHGSLGILLAYQAISLNENFQYLKQYIEKVRSKVLTTPLSKVDSLCCGTPATMELLGNSKDIESASLRTGVSQWLLEEMNLGRAPRLLMNSKENFLIPGLFSGVSGVGYQLLRHTKGCELPSLLLFEN
ncbi:type 2 lantipeptide synthetase LanM [bacterium]|nr:type 2 lantipeptide synthetase LanM [bacterium]